MASLRPREVVPYISGNDAQDVLIGTRHFNLTTLHKWNYTLYSNSTLSNTSSCYLTFPPYTPAGLFPNGSFVNATSCFTPVNPIATRGITSLVFGTLFFITVLFTLINLRKHGQVYLPREKRWSPVGRRTQWYWQLFVAACGIISTFTATDVDRDYLQSTALILQSFFYTLMLPGLLACVWESVRQWGSWQERQVHDEDPFALRPNDMRARTEFYLPLIFYALDWLVFFMLIPRPWTPIQLQRSPSQTKSIAEPAATDVRFKVGSVLAVLAWCVTSYSLAHSLHHYMSPSPRSSRFRLLLTRISIGQAPTRLVLSIIFLAIRTAYTLASAFLWPISPYNISATMGWLYGLGYAPALLVLTIFNVYGYIDENEDKLLIAQRARRGDNAGRELASLRPSWWSKSNVKTQRRAGRDVEVRENNPLRQATDDEDASGYWWWRRRKEEEAEAEADAARQRKKALTDAAANSSGGSSLRYTMGSSMLAHDDVDHLLRWKQKHGSVGGESTVASSTRSGTSRESKAQVVRSMLDV